MLSGLLKFMLLHNVKKNQSQTLSGIFCHQRAIKFAFSHGQKLCTKDLPQRRPELSLKFKNWPVEQ